MKLFPAVLSVTASLKLSAQHLLNDSTYQSRDSLTFRIGEQITIGDGTLPDGAYKYIYLNPAKWYVAASSNGTNTPLPSGSSGYHATIIKINKAGNEKMGYKYLLTLLLGTKADVYLIDIEPALRTGEVVKQSSQK